MINSLPDIRHGLVRKPPIDITHGLVKKGAEKPSKQGEKQEAAPQTKVLTHPSGTVTGIDEETGLPIVRRETSGKGQPNVSETSPIGKEEPASGRDILHASNDPDAIAEKVKAEHPAVKVALKEAISGVKGAKLHGDRDEKPEERVDEKIQDEGQSPRTIPDYSGFRVAVDSHEARHQAVDAIKGKLKVVREKDEFEQGAPDTGFHGHMLQVQQPDSDVTHEVQVLPKQVAETAEATHDLYEKARSGDKAAAAEMKGKNDQAWKQFQESQPKGGNKGKTPELGAGGVPNAPPATIKVGDAVKLPDGKRATVTYVPSPGAQLPTYRFKTDDGKSVTVKGRDMAGVKHQESDGEWVGFDLDKTLAHYTTFKGPTVIGAPIPKMVDRAKQHLKDGDDVRILTARVSDDKSGATRKAIGDWTEKHLGQRLQVTNRKDSKMKKLYDDRAVQVVPNEGTVVGEHA